MASDVTLTPGIRSNLLSLTQTAKVVALTRARLATGLKVAKATDGPVDYFQAKALSERAADLLTKKDAIDQGVSSLGVALQAVESTEDIFAQMKGLLLSAKTGSAEDRASLAKQFNELALQANNLLDDASYQGINLVTSTASALNVSFSEKTGSALSIDGTDVRVSTFAGLDGGAASAVATTLAGLNIGWSAVNGSVSLFDAAVDTLDGAITTIRTNAATLGSNVSLMNARLEFTT
ncbi:MAG: flagellin-like protein, partial [Rhodospirillales bacterium]|nr:flagellin-like protein [Rhodospirillales bacterium]